MNKTQSKNLFKKTILLIIHSHLDKCKKEDDPMFQEAMNLIIKDIDWFFKISPFNRVEYETIKELDEEGFLKDIFNNKEFHFIAFVLSLFDRFIEKGLNIPVVIFKRKTQARVKLYKRRIKIAEEKLSKDAYENWKKDEKEAYEIAKKVWEKHKEYLKLTDKDFKQEKRR